jgi:hypothetical protein
MPRINILNASWISAVLSMIYFSTAAAGMNDNVVGIVADGSPVPDGGLDNDGYAYSASLLGNSITWGGSTFTLGAAGTADAASGTTIVLPAGHDSTVRLLATAVNGDQVNQTFVVTYTDGTSTSFKQNLSDWFTPQSYAGESVASTMTYRIASSGASSSGPCYLYGYSFAINSAKSVKSITLPNNRNVVVLAVAVSASGGGSTAAAGMSENVVGIVADGSPVPDGGLDNDGYAYSASLLGNSLTWDGSTFKLGAAGTADAASGTTIALPAGKDSTVKLLATAVNGDQVNQTFVVTYTDGTTTSFKQSLSDWFTPRNYGGESKVSEMAYRIASSGASSSGPCYLYGYSFAINSAKTVKSIILPNNRNVVVLALAVSASGTASFTAATPSLSPAPGTYTSAQSVTLSDSTPGALIYYTTNGTTPTMSSAQYSVGTPLQISSTTKIEAIAVASGYTSSAATGGTYTIASATTPPPTLAIAGTPATTATVGHFYSFAPTVVASGGSPLTYSVANLPTWAQFSTTTGTLSGTPTPGSASTDANIRIAVSNGSQSVALPVFSIAVAPAAVSTALPVAPATNPAPTNFGTWNNVTPSNMNLNGNLDCGNYGVETVQVDPATPSNVYAWAHCQGLWKSTDYGQTWTGPISTTGTNGALASDCAGGIAIPPGSTASIPTIYLACIRGGTVFGSTASGSAVGFWASADGGIDWTSYGIAPLAANRQDVYPPVVDPYNQKHLLMCGHEQDYLVESTDGGQTWTNVTLNNGMLENGGTCFVFFINTGNASTTSQTWLWLAQGSGGTYGTWRTTNGGTTWTQVDKNEHPHGSSQIYQPDNNGVVYMAGVYSAEGWGVLRSTDYGQTWVHEGGTSNEAVVTGTPNNLYSIY